MIRAGLATWLPILAFYLFLPAAALVCWGELASSGAVLDLHFWDKSLHFIAYFGLAGILCVALKGDRRVVTATLLVALLGAVLEFLQGFTGRDPSVADELANSLGAGFGAATGGLILKLLAANSLAPRVASPHPGGLANKD